MTENNVLSYMVLMVLTMFFGTVIASSIFQSASCQTVSKALLKSMKLKGYNKDYKQGYNKEEMVKPYTKSQSGP